MLSHETHSAAEAEQTLSSKASEKAPSISQLWSVIEFSRQFPELTMCLVADLNNAALSAEQKRQRFEAALDELRFPALTALDPRELRQKRQPEQQPAAAPAEDIALFAAGRLPPDLPAPAVRRQKKTLWRHLLSLFSAAAFLVWLFPPF